MDEELSYILLPLIVAGYARFVIHGADKLRLLLPSKPPIDSKARFENICRSAHSVLNGSGPNNIFESYGIIVDFKSQFSEAAAAGS